MGLDQPILDLEGVGPATAASFRTAGYAVIGDLLRAPATTLHAVVRPLASLAEVTGWQNAAYLVEVRGMSPQWAEALVAGGVDSLERFVAASYESLVALFAAAAAAGVIPDVPPPAILHGMAGDAATLAASGTTTIEVVDPAGAPVVDARVRVGTVRGRTNETGRCRLSRIRLGGASSLSVEAAEFPPLYEEAVPVAAGPSVFLAVRRTLGGDGRVEPARLDEYDGATLPAFSGQPIVFDDVDDVDVRAAEVVHVRSIDARRGVATLHSVFRTLDGGTIRVRRMKAPIAALAPDAKPTDFYRRLGLAWVRTPSGPERANAWRESRRAFALAKAVPGYVAGDLTTSLSRMVAALRLVRTVRIERPSP